MTIESFQIQEKVVIEKNGWFMQKSHGMACFMQEIHGMACFLPTKID